jgi:hypothetical protein
MERFDHIGEPSPTTMNDAQGREEGSGQLELSLRGGQKT